MSSSTAQMSLSTSNTISGTWPDLGSGIEKASTVSDDIITKIKNTATGIGLAEELGHFTLGEYYIDAELLEPHPTQRPIDNKHLDTLLQEFKARGVLRSENPGVVIGLGAGWMHMKNTSPNPLKITKNTEFIYHLSTNNEVSPIAQVIRGNHRTEAIKMYAADEKKPEESYWLYKVLIPCTFFFFGGGEGLKQ